MKTKPTALTIALLASLAGPAGAQTAESVAAQSLGSHDPTPVAVTFPKAGEGAGQDDNAPTQTEANQLGGAQHLVQPAGKNAQQPGSPEQPGATPADAPVTADAEVKEGNGLAKAIEQATEALKDGKKDSFTIKITTKDAQQLPAEINAKGKIIIIGVGDEPAGVGAKPDVPRTALTPADGDDDGTEIKSPVEIRGVEVKGFNHDLFKAAQSLIIANSVFEGTPEAAKDEYVVKSDLDDNAKDAPIEIRDSAISNAGVIEVSDGEGKVTIKKNVITHTPSADDPTIDVDDDLDYPANGAHAVVIEGNAFTSTKAKANTAHVRIARPDVTVHNNAFTLTTPEAGAAGVQVENPLPKDGVPVKNVKVSYNRFSGGTAVANNTGTPLSADALAINQNDFSKADAVLPKGKDDNDPLGTKTPPTVIDATKNFWGDKKTDDVAAITTDPLTAYTPPKDDDGGNPPGSGGGGGGAPGTPSPSPSPSDSGTPGAPGTPGPAGPRKATRVAGETRFATAVQISKDDFKDGAKAVILARGDVAADSVSAVPLAEELDAPVLLTPSDSLHPEAAKEIQRLLPQGGKVIFMGGTTALSQQVEDAVTKIGGQVERIAGANRAGTAVETANRLHKDEKLKELLVADGSDWQADLIAGPAAAEVDGATLLTNGEQMAPETQAFLAQHPSVKVTAIGSAAIKAGETPAPATDPSASPSEGGIGVPKPTTSPTAAPVTGGSGDNDSASPKATSSEAGNGDDGITPFKGNPLAKSQVAKSQVEPKGFFTAVDASTSPSPSSSSSPSSSPSPSSSAGASPSASPSATPPGSGGSGSGGSGSGGTTGEGRVNYANKIDGKGTELSLAVAKAYFKTPKAIGVATTDDFADALAGGAQISEKDGPIILVAEPVASQVKDYLKANSSITNVMVYGGTARLSDEAMKVFTE